MITPVEKGSTSTALIFNSLATISQTALVFFTPSFPVPALADPVFTTRAFVDFPNLRCSLATIIGAAMNLFFVNIPATLAPLSIEITNKSFCDLYLISASAIPN